MCKNKKNLTGCLSLLININIYITLKGLSVYAIFLKFNLLYEIIRKEKRQPDFSFNPTILI
jgi:hypothetical protein